MPIDFKDITVEKIEELCKDGFALVVDGDKKILHIEIDE